MEIGVVVACLINIVALMAVIVVFIKENKIDKKYEKIALYSNNSENISQEEIDKIEIERGKLKSKLKIILVCCMIIFGVGMASFFINTDNCSEEEEMHILTK